MNNSVLHIIGLFLLLGFTSVAQNTAEDESENCGQLLLDALSNYNEDYNLPNAFSSSVLTTTELNGKIGQALESRISKNGDVIVVETDFSKILIDSRFAVFILNDSEQIVIKDRKDAPEVISDMSGVIGLIHTIECSESGVISVRMKADYGTPEKWPKGTYFIDMERNRIQRTVFTTYSSSETRTVDTEYIAYSTKSDSSIQVDDLQVYIEQLKNDQIKSLDQFNIDDLRNKTP